MKRFVYFIYIFLSLFSFDFVHGAAAIVQDNVVIPELSGTFDGTILTLNATTVTIPDGDAFTNVSYSIGSTLGSGNIIENNLLGISGTVSFTYVAGNFTIQNVPFTGSLSFLVEGDSVVFDSGNPNNHILSIDFQSLAGSFFASGTDESIIADFVNKAYRGNITGITSLDITIVEQPFLRQTNVILDSVTGTLDGTTLTLDPISSFSLPDDATAVFNGTPNKHVTNITYTNIVFDSTTGVSGVFAVHFHGLASFTYVEGGFSIEEIPFLGTLRFVLNETGFLDFVPSENVYDIQSDVFDDGGGQSYFADYTDTGIIEDFGNKVYQVYVAGVTSLNIDITEQSFLRQTGIALHSITGTFDGTTLTLDPISSFSFKDDHTAVYNGTSNQHVTGIRYTNVTFTPTQVDEYGIFAVHFHGHASFTYDQGNFSIEQVPFIGTLTFQKNEHGFIEFVPSVGDYDL
ncbi:hypothetical protein EBQ93_01290, partial [bacterium]|nr:hypothetical protein [bacterium]